MIKVCPALLALFVGGALAGCQAGEGEPPPSVRPVFSVLVTPKADKVTEFAGTIEPRYRSGFGFRVLGRVVARDVYVGDLVKRGSRLAAIDPLAFQLAVRTAQAEVSNAQAQLQNASATEARQKPLFEKSATSQAQLEVAQRAKEGAEAALARARSNLAKAEEQLGYTQLRADFDGVVTAVDAEVGQVVQPGQDVVTLARPDVLEAVADMPESVDGALRPGRRFEVALQLNPAVKASGGIREIGPQADAATRTRRVRITLNNPPTSFRLGTTVTIIMKADASREAIELPPSAILNREGHSFVWIVDPDSRTVSLRKIIVAERDGSFVRVTEGLSPGTRVVTAGVNSLVQGQAVKLLEDAP